MTDKKRRTRLSTFIPNELWVRFTNEVLNEKITKEDAVEQALEAWLKGSRR